MTIIMWGDDVLRSVGIRRRYEAANLVRFVNQGIGIRPTSAIVMAEAAPSILLGSSDAAQEFQTNVTEYYAPEGEGDIIVVAPADQPTKVVDKTETSGVDPKAPDKVLSGGSGTKPQPTTTDSVRLPPKPTLPF